MLTLSVSGRESEDASLDFYNIARDIFPELKKLDIESVKKSGEEIEVEDMTVGVKDIIYRNKGDYTFDIVTDTGIQIKWRRGPVALAFKQKKQ